MPTQPSTPELLERWSAELERARDGQEPDQRISRELFQRVAFLKQDQRGNANSEGRLAHEGLITLHDEQIRSWIRRTTSDLTDGEIDEIIFKTSNSIWRAFGPAQYREALGTRHPGFDYWRACFINAARRRGGHKGSKVLDLDEETQADERPTSTPDDVAMRVQEILDSKCNSDTEHIIARRRFVEGKKPQEIAKEIGQSVDEVYRQIRLIKERLQRDEELRGIFLRYFSE